MERVDRVAVVGVVVGRQDVDTGVIGEDFLTPRVEVLEHPQFRLPEAHVRRRRGTVVEVVVGAAKQCNEMRDCLLHPRHPQPQVGGGAADDGKRDKPRVLHRRAGDDDVCLVRLRVKGKRLACPGKRLGGAAVPLTREPEGIAAGWSPVERPTGTMSISD